MSTAIEFNHVGKQYRLGLVGTGTLSQDLNRWWQTSVLHREDPYLKIGDVNDRSVKANSDFVWALRDIDFKVEEGDVVGIIGKNGAGKSTLLKLLSRVTTPTVGTIHYKGRLAALLEVGTGFHGEMTGRENIYMNGAILGMTKAEIDRKLDEIIDFSGCEKYIDTPVKRYSSGMTVRLGFAVAAFLEPEILIVDEVLAVGDAEFQKKAIGKMQDVASGGRTVLFVSHNMASIRSLCTRGILLEYGRVKFQDVEINKVVDFYLADQKKTENRFIDNISEKKDYITIHSVVVNGQNENPIRLNEQNLELDVCVEGEIQRDERIALEVVMCDKNAVPLAFASKAHYTGITPLCKTGSFRLTETFHLPREMSEGEYYLDIDLATPGIIYHCRMEKAVKLEYEGFMLQSGQVRHYANGAGLLMLR